MQVCVKLPTNPLIDYLSFCQSIAQALHPADEKDIAGLDCITGKIVTHHVPMGPPARTGLWPIEAAMQSVLISDDGRTLDQLAVDPSFDTMSGTPGLDFAEPARVQVVELSLPYALTDDDRRELEKLLPRLPALRYPISDEDEAAFMDAYVRQDKSPAWKPTLVTTRTIERRKVDQGAAMLHHQQALQEEFANGRLVSVDSRYVPTVALAAGCYIPKEQAIAYLTRIGIGCHDQDIVDDRSAAETPEPEAPEPEAPEPEAQPKLSDKTRRRVGEPTLTEQQIREIVERRDELKTGKVKGFCKKTAEEFGISRRYVYDLAKAAEAAKKAIQIDHALASGRK